MLDHAGDDLIGVADRLKEVLFRIVHGALGRHRGLVEHGDHFAALDLRLFADRQSDVAVRERIGIDELSVACRRLDAIVRGSAERPGERGDDRGTEVYEIIDRRAVSEHVHRAVVVGEGLREIPVCVGDELDAGKRFTVGIIDFCLVGRSERGRKRVCVIAVRDHFLRDRRAELADLVGNADIRRRSAIIDVLADDDFCNVGILRLRARRLHIAVGKVLITVAVRSHKVVADGIAERLCGSLQGTAVLEDILEFVLDEVGLVLLIVVRKERPVAAVAAPRSGNAVAVAEILRGERILCGNAREGIADVEALLRICLIGSDKRICDFLSGIRLTARRIDDVGSRRTHIAGCRRIGSHFVDAVVLFVDDDVFIPHNACAAAFGFDIAARKVLIFDDLFVSTRHGKSIAQSRAEFIVAAVKRLRKFARHEICRVFDAVILQGADIVVAPAAVAGIDEFQVEQGRRIPDLPTAALVVRIDESVASGSNRISKDLPLRISGCKIAACIQNLLDPFVDLCDLRVESGKDILLRLPAEEDRTALRIRRKRIRRRRGNDCGAQHGTSHAACQPEHGCPCNQALFCLHHSFPPDFCFRFVIWLLFYAAQSNALDKVFLHEYEEDENGNRHQNGECHQRPVIHFRRCLEELERHCKELVLRTLQHDVRPHEIVPAALEREDPEREQSRKDERKIDPEKNDKLPRSVNARALRHFVGKRHKELPHEKDPVDAYRSGQDHGGKIVVKTNTALSEQIVSARKRKPKQHKECGNERYDAGDHHRTEHDVEDDLVSRKPYLGERVCRKRAEKQVGRHADKRCDKAVQQHLKERDRLKNCTIMIPCKDFREPCNGEAQDLIFRPDGGYDRPIKGQTHDHRKKDEQDIQQSAGNDDTRNLFAVIAPGIAFSEIFLHLRFRHLLLHFFRYRFHQRASFVLSRSNRRTMTVTSIMIIKRMNDCAAAYPACAPALFPKEFCQMRYTGVSVEFAGPPSVST